MKFRQIIRHFAIAATLFSLCYVCSQILIKPPTKQVELSSGLPRDASTTYAAPIFSTYFGGSAVDAAYGIQVDSAGNIFIAGSTSSTDFPLVNAYNSTYGGGTDALVAKLSPQGTILWSTLMGGSSIDIAWSIAIDAGGNCFIVGDTDSPDFPIKNGNDTVLQGTQDGFVAKYSPTGVLLWSSFLGGNAGTDEAFGVATDAAGDCFICGNSFSSTGFPLYNSYDSTLRGSADIFLVKMNPLGNITWSTYLGGTGSEYGYALAVNASGDCFVGGITTSVSAGAGFPLTAGLDTTYGGGQDGYLAAFNGSTGQPMWGTYLGGSGEDDVLGITAGIGGDWFVTGLTATSDFPAFGGYNSSFGGGYDAYITKFLPNGTISWSTFLGGPQQDEGIAITADSNENIYALCITKSSSFPTVNPWNATYGGGFDLAVVKMNSAGNLLWSSFYGGTGDDNGGGQSIAVDGVQDIYIAGFTTGSLPLVNPLSTTLSGTQDGLIAKFLFVPDTAPVLADITPNPSTNGIVTLSWTNITRATTYIIYRENAPISNSLGLVPINSTAQLQVQDNVTKNGTYYYAVLAHNAAGDGPLSVNKNVVVAFPPSSQSQNGQPFSCDVWCEILIIAGIAAVAVVVVLILYKRLNRKEKSNLDQKDEMTQLDFD